MPEMGLPRISQKLDFTCGAACFESMLQYYRLPSLGEEEISKRLKTLELGYTPPENIVTLARQMGLASFLLENSDLSLIQEALDRGEVIFVTWWDEDAGHFRVHFPMELP